MKTNLLWLIIAAALMGAGIVASKIQRLPILLFARFGGTRGADRFLLDQVRRRMDFQATVAAVRTMTAKWPRASGKVIEDKANGTGVIATLKHEIDGLIAVNPEGGKIARAAAISPQIESGNVYLPHPEPRSVGE